LQTIGTPWDEPPPPPFPVPVPGEVPGVPGEPPGVDPLDCPHRMPDCDVLTRFPRLRSLTTTVDTQAGAPGLRAYA